MIITDPRTGRNIHLFRSDELAKELSDLHLPCDHLKIERRRFVVGGGQIQVWDQCSACGAKVGTPKKVADRDSLPLGDDGLSEAYISSLRDRRREIEIRHIDLHLAHQASNQLAYAEYRKSEAWRSRRRKVLERCGKQCEGCGERPATQVHHLTYQHICEEFLFELVGICEVCHLRMHNEEEEDEARAS